MANSYRSYGMRVSQSFTEFAATLQLQQDYSFRLIPVISILISSQLSIPFHLPIVPVSTNGNRAVTLQRSLPLYWHCQVISRISFQPGMPSQQEIPSRPNHEISIFGNSFGWSANKELKSLWL